MELLGTLEAEVVKHPTVVSEHGFPPLRGAWLSPTQSTIHRVLDLGGRVAASFALVVILTSSLTSRLVPWLTLDSMYQAALMS